MKNNGWREEIKKELLEARELLKDAEDAQALLEAVEELSDTDRIRTEKAKARVEALLKRVETL